LGKHHQIGTPPIDAAVVLIQRQVFGAVEYAGLA
jgi:hypothetical protein